MAEAKNTFLKSKMNKDLDDRILPNGEYRDALNISVGRSEDNDVGSLENILGNSLIAATASNNTNLKCIGKFEDEVGNRIFQILTDYTDADATCQTINYPSASTTVEMKITVFDLNNNTYSTLVEGKFLNFAKNRCWQVTGINLVEDLLFWTDNRNQPRKINVTTAIGNPNYYTEESQISVAKYMPQKAPELYKEVDTTVVTVTDTKNFILETITGISVDMFVVSNAAQNVGAESILGSEYIRVTAIDTATNTVTINADPATPVVVGQRLRFIETTMTNESGDTSWPGDPRYLEDKYVRFAYRFQFDDGEYSLMSPFTQIAFIPQQSGFFLNGNETQAYESTIVKWFENNVDNVKLRISLPGVGTNVNLGGSVSKNVLTEYKIQNIDILYKESNGLVVKVLKTISGTTMASEMDENIYVYEYQSEKPYKTLTEGQTTRVYDKVPVRTLAQSVAGNRVIYGNFKDKHTPYDTLDYNCTVQEKNDLYTSWAEYPNHTIKQNRTYQIGFVLADKFGRQSSVILSTYDTLSAAQGSTIFGGSTVFHPYYDANDSLDVKSWFGDAALILLNQTIGDFTIGSSDRNLATGTPGIYGEPKASWVVDNNTNDSLTYNAGTNRWTLSFSTPTIGSDLPTIATTDMYLRGEYVDYTQILSISSAAGVTSITTLDKPNSYYLYLIENTDTDTKFAYSINALGWYSYKIVVKQREQDYYNAYLPGFLDGYPEQMTQGSEIQYVVDTDSVGDTYSYAANANGINEILFPGGELDDTAHAVLINDNINKIPRDLSEVGPDQKQYRSSVELFGRVNNYEGKFNITNFTHSGCTSPPCAGADQVNEIKFTGVNDPTNTAVFCPTGTCTGQEKALEPGMALLMGKCEYQGGSLPNCIPGDPQFQYPERFSNATLITKVEFDAAANAGLGETTVTFSPGGAINAGANNIIIEYGDNEQYYPTQKPDIASTVGTADDLGFYQYSVDNFNGSAARNLYQLETNPIVARFSTNQKLGVIAADMVPWLSIYETAPVDSLLDIFWESTTGWNYISDINQDVEAGSDAPGGFSPIGFKFIENQNFDGADNLILTGTTGASNSPWITDIFYPRNNTGVNLTNTTAVMTVTNLAGTDVSGDFQLEQVPQQSQQEPGGYRVKFINNNHAFLNSAATVENFTFSLAITYNNEVTTRTFPGRLQNFTPSFTLPCSDYITVTSQTETGTVIDFNAVNGTTLSSSAGTDLFFDITAGNSSNYFVLNGLTGILTLNQSLGQNVPLGVYPLTVRVRDAYLSSSNPPDLQNAVPEYATMQATCTFTITVGPEMVPPYYQGFFESEPIWTQEGNTNTNPCQSSNPCLRMGIQPSAVDSTTGAGNGTGLPQGAIANGNNFFGIGGFYFGPRQNGGAGTTPIYTDQAPNLGTGGNGGVYNMVSHVVGDIGSSLNLTPVALTSGAMIVTVNLENIMDCPNSDATPDNNAEIQWVRIFHRAASTTTPNPLSWVEINDANQSFDSSSGTIASSPAYDLQATVRRSSPQTSANWCSTTGVFYIDANQLPGEYFIAVKTTYNAFTGVQNQGCCACDGSQYGIQGFYQGYSYITTEDANFDFSAGAQDQGVLYSYPYTVQINGGTTSTFPNTSILPITNSETVYAHAKYGSTVRQFFSDSALLTPWEPNQGVQGDLYHTFEGGLIQNYKCVQGGSCQTGQRYWTVYTNPGDICSQVSTWSPPTEPFNQLAASKVVYKGKFSASGEVVNGYTIGDPSYASDSANVILAQSFNGTGSVVGPTDVKAGGIPVTRFAGMSGLAGNICQ
ncbi:MAG: hypothetical protein CMJ25_26870 [Phycisphaerae bacterium]|nr:hypothetical protein [Phycisphaerae bacterium]